MLQWPVLGSILLGVLVVHLLPMVGVEFLKQTFLEMLLWLGSLSVCHLHLAKELLQRAASAVQPSAEERDAIARQVASEVGESLVCTEVALSYLGTLASVHRAVTGGLQPKPHPCELSQLLRSVATIIRPQLSPDVEPIPAFFSGELEALVGGAAAPAAAPPVNVVDRV